jgi:hypothetical protein
MGYPQRPSRRSGDTHRRRRVGAGRTRQGFLPNPISVIPRRSVALTPSEVQVQRWKALRPHADGEHRHIPTRKARAFKVRKAPPDRGPPGLDLAHTLTTSVAFVSPSPAAPHQHTRTPGPRHHHSHHPPACAVMVPEPTSPPNRVQGRLGGMWRRRRQIRARLAQLQPAESTS